MRYWWRSPWKVFVVTLGVCGVVVWFVSAAQNQETTVRAPEKEPQPVSAVACDHFRNVIDDGAAGILTRAELREKVRQVYDDAISGSDVEEAARDLLAAATQGEGLEGPMVALSDACEAVGH